MFIFSVLRSFTNMCWKQTEKHEKMQEKIVGHNTQQILLNSIQLRHCLINYKFSLLQSASRFHKLTFFLLKKDAHIPLSLPLSFNHRNVSLPAQKKRAQMKTYWHDLNNGHPNSRLVDVCHLVARLHCSIHFSLKLSKFASE